MRKPKGYCRINAKICMANPIEGKKRIIDGEIFMELEYPDGCPMMDYLNIHASLPERNDGEKQSYCGDCLHWEEPALCNKYKAVMGNGMFARDCFEPNLQGGVGD